jgi:hypothetical protein
LIEDVGVAMPSYSLPEMVSEQTADINMVNDDDEQQWDEWATMKEMVNEYVLMMALIVEWRTA